ncbi:Helicase required for RNAi-mediated heterochromatin assembly 1 [Diplonema papillatum]|nr:Helicase required for RNAi-mediated heterochromatin assembly 1 [Diplonema papillatum]
MGGKKGAANHPYGQSQTGKGGHTGKGAGHHGPSGGGKGGNGWGQNGGKKGGKWHKKHLKDLVDEGVASVSQASAVVEATAKEDPLLALTILADSSAGQSCFVGVCMTLIPVPALHTDLCGFIGRLCDDWVTAQHDAIDVKAVAPDSRRKLYVRLFKNWEFEQVLLTADLGTRLLQHFIWMLQEATLEEEFPAENPLVQKFLPTNHKLPFRYNSLMPDLPELLVTPELPPKPDKGAADSEVYLNRQFRLIREDMLAPLRKALDLHLEVLRNPNRKDRDAIHAQKHWFDSARIETVHIPGCNSVFGKELQDSFFVVQFSYSPQSGLVNLTTKQRKAMLENSNKMLADSSVVAFIDTDAGHTVVALAEIARSGRSVDVLSSQKPRVGIMFWDAQHASRLMARTAPLLMVQLGSSLFSYPPMLRRLQTVQSVPAADVILQADFSRSIPEGECADVVSWIPSVRSSMDGPQEQALRAIMQRPISIIHGPPGTGKTHVGTHAVKLLWDNCPAEQILLVAYTNHTVDQFMENLHYKRGIPLDNMVRLGSGCKSDTLQPTQLRELTSKLPKNPSVGRAFAMLMEQRGTFQASIDKLLPAATGCLNPKWWDVKNALTNAGMLDVVEELTTQTGADGFTIVGKKSKSAKEWDNYEAWLKGHPKPGQGHGRAPYPWHLDREDRRSHLGRWMDFDKKREELFVNVQGFRDVNNKRQKIGDLSRRLIVGARRVLGCTTTFLAENKELLDGVTSVFLEEAAETLECSTVLSMLSSNLRRVVLIGDHKQLRPKVESYELTVESGGPHQLNMSLFERLVIEGCPYVTLEQQHRMRPELSKLVRPTYPRYIDGPNTSNPAHRPIPDGIQQNLIFIDHNSPENSGGSTTSVDSRSHVNEFEVKMVVQILQYFLNLGYTGDKKPVVLTTYLGQLREIRAYIQKKLKWQVELSERDQDALDSDDETEEDDEGDEAPVEDRCIRVSTVDNFQGEEAGIIILSLVRCNTRGDTGFVKQAERVNVMLSRARCALVVLGSLTTLTAKSSVWADLALILRAGAHVYKGFPSQCIKHNTKKLLCTEADFKHVPNGGCTKPCGELLPCNHPCPLSCHTYPPHKHVQCTTTVARICARRHFNVVICCEKGVKKCPTCIKIDTIEKNKTRRVAALVQRTKKASDKADSQLAALRENPFSSNREVQEVVAQREKLLDENAEETARIATECKQQAAAAVEAASEAAAAAAALQGDRDHVRSCLVQRKLDLHTLAATPARLDAVFGWQGMASAVLARGPVESMAPEAARALREHLAGRGRLVDLFDAVPAGDENPTHRFLRRYCRERAGGGGGAGCLLPAVEAAERTGYLSLVLALRSGFEDFAQGSQTLAHKLLCGVVLVATLRLGHVEHSADDVVSAVFDVAKPGSRVCEATTCEHYDNAPPVTLKQACLSLAKNLANDLPKCSPEDSERRLDEQRWDEAAAGNQAFAELVAMPGLRKVKQFFYDRLLKIKRAGARSTQHSVLFTGNLGTPKSAVARLYCKALQQAKVFADAGNFIETSGASLATSGTLGATLWLRNLQKLASGGVLFVDEASVLFENPLEMRALDILLAKMKAHVGKLTVVFAGYDQPLDERLACDGRLPPLFPAKCVFEDYTDDELLEILQGYMREDVCSDDNLPRFTVQEPRYVELAVRRIGRQRGHGFDNANAMRRLYRQMCSRHAARMAREERTGRMLRMLAKSDILGVAAFSVRRSEPYKQLHAMVGLIKVKDAVDGMLDVFEGNLKLEEDLKPLRTISLNRVFAGNPGTGKKAVAELYAKMLKEAGVLSKGDVHLKTATDFLGTAPGESGEKTSRILEAAKGGVLVIDEAYGLNPKTGFNSTCPYREEVINTMVEKISGGTGSEDRAVVLLGYTKEMAAMIKTTNPGFQRRFQFTDAWEFEDFSDDDLFKILKQALLSKKLAMPHEDMLRVVREVLGKQRLLPNFGNADAVRHSVSEACVRQSARLKREEREGASTKSDPCLLTYPDFDPTYRPAVIHVARNLSSPPSTTAGHPSAEACCKLLKRKLGDERVGLEPGADDALSDGIKRCLKLPSWSQTDVFAFATRCGEALAQLDRDVLPNYVLEEVFDNFIDSREDECD